MTHTPGIRPVDPEAEIARLTPERLDPPGREWAIRHPRGKITVRLDGHAIPSRAEAERERAASDEDCEWCDGGTHALIYRDRQAWQEA